ncbi:hypothetical protein DYB26_013024 [Aphanomyces astaci]|uniref:N-acetylglucosaminylphosphatidylinositol deacetylase n=1 Tax=Aphanomyces astaci TaxID=112090 RepID=A0A397DJ66_APHAT|nr:hypothetical protein DYB38_006188 [Aphanomyces astaci]RHZ07599.1 hypothetical protein DYB26_013024 [Aphanomyces astaci]RHZ32494.1 hypothetical protein DYB31_011839 [Aphanomyces astaci]
MMMSTCLAMVVALVCAATIVASVDWEILEDNKLYVGGDLHSTSQTSIDGCAVDCRALPPCDRFVWTKKQGGTCYLKSFAKSTVPAHNGAVAGRLTSSAPPSSNAPSSLSPTSTSPIQDHHVGAYPLPTVAFHTMAHAMWATTAYPLELFTVNLTDGNPLFQPPLLDERGDNITPFHHVESVGECAQITSVFALMFFTYLPTSQLCIPLQSSPSNASTIRLRRAPPPSPANSSAARIPPTSTESAAVVPLSVLVMFEQATKAADSVDACDTVCGASSSCAASRWNASNHTHACVLYGPKDAPGHVQAIAGWISPPSMVVDTTTTTSTKSQVDSTQMRSPPPPTSLSPPSKVHFFILAHPDDSLLFMMQDVLTAMVEDPTAKVVFVCVTAGDAGRADGWWEAREAGAVAALQFIARVTRTSGNDEADNGDDEVHEQQVQMDGYPVLQVTVGSPPSRLVQYFLRLSEAGWNDLLFEQDPKGSKTSPVLTRSQDDNNLTTAALELHLQDVHAIVRAIIKTEAYGVADVSVGAQSWAVSPHDDDELDHELHMATGQFVANTVIQSVPLWQDCLNQRYYFGYQRWRHSETMTDPFRMYQRHMWMVMSKVVQDQYPLGYPPWLDHAHTFGRQYIDHSISSTKACHT